MTYWTANSVLDSWGRLSSPQQQGVLCILLSALANPDKDEYHVVCSKYRRTAIMSSNPDQKNESHFVSLKRIRTRSRVQIPSKLSCFVLERPPQLFEIPEAGKSPTWMGIQRAAAKWSVRSVEYTCRVGACRSPASPWKNCAFALHLLPTKHGELSSRGTMEHIPKRQQKTILFYPITTTTLQGHKYSHRFVSYQTYAQEK